MIYQSDGKAQIRRRKRLPPDADLIPFRSDEIGNYVIYLHNILSKK